MSNPVVKFRTVYVELPSETLRAPPWDPESVSRELQLLWVVEQVRRGVISTGKGAELVDLPKGRFLQMLSERGVPVLHVDPEEYDDEFGPAPAE